MYARIRRCLAAVLLGAALLPAAGPSSTAATSPPSGLKAVSVSRAAIALSWKAISGVPKYRIQYSTSSTMKGATYRRFVDPYAEITGLQASTTYYFKVRAITTDGRSLSSYSGAIRVKTASAGGYIELSPAGLTASGTSTDSISLTWNARGSNDRYRVSWSTSSSFAEPGYVRVTGTARTLTGLAAGQKYYVKVRVIDPEGRNLSSYSPSVAVTTTASASGFAFDPPSRLAVVETARTAVALTWAAVPQAERYRVQYSSSSSMASARYVRTSNTALTVTELTAGDKYYFKVRVIKPDGTNLSAYSDAVSATTPTTSAASYLPPDPVTMAPDGANRMTVSWPSRGSGLTYEVLYSANKDLSYANSFTTTSTKATLSGLSAATTYWAKVRVVDVSGSVRSARSAYSAIVSSATKDSVPTTLKVASYNIKCANCYSALTDEGTWYQRRQAVVDTIIGQKPDVIGIQEASQAWLKADDGAGKAISLSQFEDLTNRLGSPYKLTNTNRNNCVKSTTPTSCEYKDQGASQGTKIIYDSSKLTLVSQGSKQLTEIKASDNDRYVAWAIFELKSSGKRFFFADAHLEHADGTDYFGLRTTQTQEVVAVVRAKNEGLPTYVVGDFNSSKWTSPSNAPYDVMTGAGFVDPLGNSYRSTTTTTGATVVKRIRTNFSSYNGFNRRAPHYSSYINGSYIDYIWTSKGIEVPEWETVVNIDSANDFVGTIPSDHNLIRATTTLP